MRRTVAERIDKGLTDRQILEELVKEYGPELLRPHLLP
jgi:cytochrome c-type biogenesis protein CcmH/NrfF